MKTDFVSHVSHELRTPLSSIKAYAELLVDGEAADEKTRSEFYHVIQAEADRLSRLIDNILNISPIESGMIADQQETGGPERDSQAGAGGGDALGRGETDRRWWTR